MLLNDNVCISGAATDIATTCGMVTSVTSSYSDNDPDFNYTFEDPRADYCAQSGDSGAPIYQINPITADVIIRGLHSGSDGGLTCFNEPNAEDEYDWGMFTQHLTVMAELSLLTGGGFASSPSYSMPTHERAMAGDFDGDGNGDIFFYHSGSTPDVIWYGLGLDEFLVKTVAINGTYTPIAGDFDSDGRNDIFWYAAGAGADYIWYGTATKGTFDTQTFVVNGTYQPFAGNFNGAGAQDIFWYAPGTSADYVTFFQTNRTSTTVTGHNVNGTYTPVAGDYDGDGADDIFWYNAAGGASSSAAWFFNSTVSKDTISLTAVASASPVAVDTGDDGRDDVYLHRSGSSDRVMRGDSGRSFTPFNIYEYAGTAPLGGDFNGDGHGDVFLYAPGSSADDLLLFDGTRTYESMPAVVNGTYELLAVDLGGDGWDEVVFINGSGVDYIWWS